MGKPLAGEQDMQTCAFDGHFKEKHMKTRHPQNSREEILEECARDQLVFGFFRRLPAGFSACGS